MADAPAVPPLTVAELARLAAMDELTATLDLANCQGLCQRECVHVHFTPLEERRLAQRGVTYPNILGAPRAVRNSPCPLLTEAGGCSVYLQRPSLCHAYGAIEAMRCRYSELCSPPPGQGVSDARFMALNLTLMIMGNGTHVLAQDVDLENLPARLERALSPAALAGTLRRMLHGNALPQEKDLVNTIMDDVLQGLPPKVRRERAQVLRARANQAREQALRALFGRPLGAEARAVLEEGAQYIAARRFATDAEQQQVAKVLHDAVKLANDTGATRVMHDVLAQLRADDASYGQQPAPVTA